MKSAGEGEVGDWFSVGEELGERNGGEILHSADSGGDRIILILGAWNWDWCKATAWSKSFWLVISWWSFCCSGVGRR